MAARTHEASDAVAQQSREGLELIAQLLLVLVDDEAGAPGVIDRAERVALHHLTHLCGTLVALSCGDSGGSAELLLRPSSAPRGDCSLQCQSYLLGAAALLCGWLLRRVALSAAAEAALSRRLGLGSVWWWTPPDEHRGLSWEIPVLRSAVDPLDPTEPPPTAPDAGVWEAWLWAAAGGSALERECGLLHDYLGKILELSAAVSDRRRVPLSRSIGVDDGSMLRLIHEHMGALCYQAAVRLALCAVREVAGGFESATAACSDVETQRAVVRSAFGRRAALQLRCLLAASDACRTAAAQWNSGAALELLEGGVRPALLGWAPGTERPTDDALLYVHPRVELSSNAAVCPPSPTGHRELHCGVVAAAAVEEGELLSEELPLAFWCRGGEAPQAALSGRLAALVRDGETALLALLAAGTLFGGDEPPLLLGRSTGPEYAAVAAYMRLLADLPDLPWQMKGGPLTEAALLAAALRATLAAAPNHRATPIRGPDGFKIGLVSYAAVEVAGDAWSSASTAEAGKAYFFFTSRYRHACGPNALLVFHTADDTRAPLSGHGCDAASADHRQRWFRAPAFTGRVSAVALRHIAAGEEITVSWLPSPLLPRAAKTAALGSPCTCSWCAAKAPLLEGVLCPECHQLLYDSAQAPAAGAGRAERHADPMAAVAPPPVCRGHAAACPLDLRGGGGGGGAARRFEEALERVYADADAEAELDHSRLVARLLELDAAADGVLPTTHHLRLRARQEALAVGTAAPRPSRRESAALLSLAAELMEDVELLLSPNQSLVTGLRLQYAFLRGRHITATMAPVAAAADGCCGAVREEAAVLARPFLRDPLLRGCVIRSFQEHFVQQCSWRNHSRTSRHAGRSEEDELLGGFLRRFPVELLAVGIDTPEYLSMLSVMDSDAPDDGDGTSAASPPLAASAPPPPPYERLPGDLYPPSYEPDPCCP